MDPALGGVPQPTPRQPLDCGACPRSTLLLAQVIQSSLLFTEEKPGPQRGEGLASILAGVRVATDASLGSLTFYKSPHPTLCPQAQSVSTQLVTFLEITRETPRHEVQALQGEGAGQAPRGLPRLLIFSWPLCDVMTHSEMNFHLDSPGQTNNF